MSSIFSVLASCIGIYSILCFLNIIFTWIPTPTTKFSSFLNSICEPFFSLFRFPFTKVGIIDFSPGIGIFVLYLAQEVLQAFAKSESVNAFSLIFMILAVLIRFVNSLLLIIFIILLIRLLCECIASLRYSSFCTYIDAAISRLYAVVEGITDITNRIPVLVILAALVFLVRIALSIILLAIK